MRRNYTWDLETVSVGRQRRTIGRSTKHFPEMSHGCKQMQKSLNCIQRKAPKWVIKHLSGNNPEVKMALSFPLGKESLMIITCPLCGKIACPRGAVGKGKRETVWGISVVGSSAAISVVLILPCAGPSHSALSLVVSWFSCFISHLIQCESLFINQIFYTLLIYRHWTVVE